MKVGGDLYADGEHKKRNAVEKDDPGGESLRKVISYGNKCSEGKEEIC